MLLRCQRVPQGLVPLLAGLPRVILFDRVHPRIFVERGRDHPLDLASSEPLLGGNELLLFSGDQGRVDTVAPPLTFCSARDLLEVHVIWPSGEMLRSHAPPAARVWRWPIRIVAQPAIQGPITGRLLSGVRELEWLRRIVYLADHSALRTYRVVLWPQRAVVEGPEGLPALPVGRALRKLTEQVMLPAHATLRPNLSDARLRELLSLADGDWVLLDSDEGMRWPEASWRNLERMTLCDLPMATPDPVSATKEESAVMEPGEDGLFRMFWERFR